MTGDALEVWLEKGVQSGELRPVDAAFARFGRERCPHAPISALLATACLSRAVGDGHTAWRVDEPPVGTHAPCARWVAQRWAQDPRALDAPGWIGDGTRPTPVVRNGNRLALWRHWCCEQRVAAALAARLRDAPPAPDPAILRPWIDALFGPADGGAPDPACTPDWQRLACALAARSGVFVLTGGPGTGKTTTVVRLLTLLQGLALQQGGDPLRIALAAPTGKAAARLAQSIAGAVARLPWDALPLPAPARATLRAHLPLQGQTLHRWIGRHADSSGTRHDAQHPLWLDVLVIDEASMVDLELLDETLQALPAHTRLVLIGDRDQLASVEAGAVLAQLCERAHEGRYRADVANWMHAATGQRPASVPGRPDGDALDQCVVMLHHSHRFGADSGIGQWARAVNAGDAAAVERLARTLRPDVALVTTPAVGPLAPAAWAPLLDAWRALLAHIRRGPAGAHPDAVAAWAAEALALHARAQVLCALRRGPWGVEGLNTRLIRLLCAGAGLSTAALTRPDGLYPGRPLLVTRNAPAIGVMNGDLGLLLPLLDGHGGAARWRVAFGAPDQPGGVRWALPSELPAMETAFALTVHKSQGSEFDHVLLALPPEAETPVLTRELLYTGITRARQRLTLLLPGGTASLTAAVARPTRRDSALAEALRAALP